MDRLKGKVAIVTGSTSGIGIGIAKLYASEGAKVVICGRRQEKGQAVVDEIAKDGGEAWYHFMDMTQIDSIDKLIADTVEKYGKLDILVNNAANVGLKDGRVDELTLEMWDAIFQSDLRGTFYMTKCVLPYMQKNETGGSIINIGSMASCGGDLGSTAYACAKAGVDLLTQSTALQYGKDNIQIAFINGSMNDEQRFNEVYTKFRDMDNYKVLVASDAGSTGINMSLCKYVIEYDLADSYAIQTQRHGRIERADSIHDNVFVYQLIANDSYDEIAYKIVSKKEGYDYELIKRLKEEN